jgi:hypothetical protein
MRSSGTVGYGLSRRGSPRRWRAVRCIWRVGVAQWEQRVIGATADNGGSGRTGAAHVFVRSGTTWTQQARLAAASGVAEDHFGASVSLSGDSALAGAPLRDVGAAVDQVRPTCS